jgi:hypothetical protein
VVFVSRGSRARTTALTFCLRDLDVSASSQLLCSLLIVPAASDRGPGERCPWEKTNGIPATLETKNGILYVEIHVRDDTIEWLKQKVKGLEEEVALLKQPSKDTWKMRTLRLLLKGIMVG